MRTDLTQLQHQGRQARQRGDSLVDNPMLAAEAMPAATGQALSEWQAAIQAWEAGYRQASTS
jgi:hypothetical protein